MLFDFVCFCLCLFVCLFLFVFVCLFVCLFFNKHKARPDRKKIDACGQIGENNMCMMFVLKSGRFLHVTNFLTSFETV